MRSGVKIRTNKNGILQIGKNVGFNNNCLINCMDSIKIGDNVIFGQSVKFTIMTMIVKRWNYKK